MVRKAIEHFQREREKERVLSLNHYLIQNGFKSLTEHLTEATLGRKDSVLLMMAEGSSVVETCLTRSVLWGRGITQWWASKQRENSAGNRDLAITFKDASHTQRVPQAPKLAPPVGNKCPDMSLGLRDKVPQTLTNYSVEFTMLTNIATMFRNFRR